MFALITRALATDGTLVKLLQLGGGMVILIRQSYDFKLIPPDRAPIGYVQTAYDHAHNPA